MAHSLFLSTNIRPHNFVIGEDLRNWYIEFKNKPNHLKLAYNYRPRVTASLHADSKVAEIPRQWYNIISNLPVKPPPALHPGTLQPVPAQDWSPLFPDELIKQETSNARFIDIPKEVVDVYELWRPTPLISET